jgi:hypothetical protein
MDPEEACQRAIEAGLVVHCAHPLNGETSIPALIGGVVMPSAQYRRLRARRAIPKRAPQCHAWTRVAATGEEAAAPWAGCHEVRPALVVVAPTFPG